LVATASLTLLALLGSVALTLAGLGTPLAVAHLAFAVGIVPLIFAAMIHFVPVLTRTGDPQAAIGRVPRQAQLAGLVAVLAMQGWLPHAALHVAAAVDLLLAGFLLNWIAGRSRLALGSPHPGWRWYGAALGCLMLALAAILLQSAWPAYWLPLRRFHLHVNLLGLVGLAALGTLPVLLPTALGRPDPDAAGWLRRACGRLPAAPCWSRPAARSPAPYAVPGALLLFVVTLGLGGQWLRRFGPARAVRDGVAASLSAALTGLLINLSAGVLHGAGISDDPRTTLLAWAAGFLLPLVSGALAQLLPVWWRPGPQTPVGRRCAAAWRRPAPGAARCSSPPPSPCLPASRRRGRLRRHRDRAVRDRTAASRAYPAVDAVKSRLFAFQG
jgi:hypothetical protein